MHTIPETIIIQKFTRSARKAKAIVEHNASLVHKDTAYIVIDTLSQDTLLKEIKPLQEKYHSLIYQRPQKDTAANTKNLILEALRLPEAPSNTVNRKIIILNEWDILEQDFANTLESQKTADLQKPHLVSFYTRKLDGHSETFLELDHVWIIKEKLLRKILEHNTNFNQIEEHLYLYLKNLDVPKHFSEKVLLSSSNTKEFTFFELEKFKYNKADSLRFLDLKIKNTRDFFQRLHLKMKKLKYTLFGKI